ncbi:MAG: HAMP domain-containing histidine kinase [Acidobacteriota bacterium]|nr:HAMP domain-containing histidine kinase [Acidobacteriota bacterium]
MKIVSKIAAGSGLLVVLFLAVLGYNLAHVRRLAAMQQELSRTDMSAATISLEMTRLLNRLDDFTRKLYVLRDFAYAERIEEVRTAVEDQLARLDSLGLEGRKLEEVRSLESLWLELPLAGLSQRLLTNDVDGPSEAEGDQDDAAFLDAFREKTRTLAQQAETVGRVVQSEIAEQVAAAAVASQHASFVSGIVVVIALTLSLPIFLLTLASIRDPLNRLREGAKSVAAGEFDIDLDTSGNDEFSGVATSFNQMARRLGELDRLKQDFLSHVSHELKTPLAAMEETSRLLLDELPGPLNDKQKRLLRLNLDSSHRLASMIGKLLDLSRMEERAIAYDLHPNDLGELAREVAESFEAAAAERGVLLAFEAPKDPVVAHCDRDRVIQVVANLIDNAVKFSSAGDEVRVAVASSSGSSLGTESDTSVIEVSDSGPGIPDEHKEKIFDKFHQIGAPGTSSGGVGLGLAICRQISDEHGGRLSVADNQERGSIFRVELPAAAEAADQVVS